MEDKNHFFKSVVKYILFLCLYYNYIVLALFYLIYVKAWYSLGIRPDLSGIDPKEIGFSSPLLEKTSNLLPYIWIAIVFYFLSFFSNKSKNFRVNKKHHYMFFISVFLFILTLPLLIWYAD